MPRSEALSRQREHSASPTGQMTGALWGCFIFSSSDDAYPVWLLSGEDFQMGRIWRKR